jgi:hypothetical protein
LLADAQRIEPDALLRQRFLRYQPAAEQLLQLDFMFFRLQPIRLRYIGGVGRMGWLEAAELTEACLSCSRRPTGWPRRACRMASGYWAWMPTVWITAWQRRWTSPAWPDGLKLEAERAARQALLDGLGSDLA